MSNNQSSSARSEVKKLASQISNLAQQFADKLEQGSMDMPTANQLVKDTATFTFALGLLYQEEVTLVSTKTGKNVSMRRVNYHNKRDRQGRFTKA